MKSKVILLLKLSASFDNFDKFLIVLSATSGSNSVASFATVTGTPVGIASASLSVIFSLSTGLVKLLLKQQEIRKRAYYVSQLAMLSYCLKCRKKNTQNINPVNAKSVNGGTIILSTCAVCHTKKSIC